jgi:hypothetical protein
LVISFTDLGRDSRVNRQIRALHGRYSVVAAGSGDPGVDGVRYVPCDRARRGGIEKVTEAMRLLLGGYEKHYWALGHVAELRRRLETVRADVVIANDLEALPVAIEVARGAPVVFDAHEYSPREHSRLLWRLFRQRYTEHLCRAYIPRARAVMTVAAGIAAQYERDLGVKPVVVKNSSPYQELPPRPTEEGLIRMIHHGNAVPSRHLEGLLDAMRFLDARFRLDLLLLPTVPAYVERLKRRAGGDSRIRFLPPVPMLELVRFANGYDVGVLLLPPRSFNDLHALPNKFFEFVQSRLAVAIGPSPEMAAIVERHGFGVVAADFRPESLAHALRSLDARKIDGMKQRAHEAARELSFEADETRLLSVVASAARAV